MVQLKFGAQSKLITLFLIVLMVAGGSLLFIRSTVVELVGHATPKVQAAMELEINQKEFAKDVVDYLATKNPEEKVQFADNSDDLNREYAAYLALVRTDEERYALLRFGEFMKQFNSQAKEIFALEDQQIQKREERLRLEEKVRELLASNVRALRVDDSRSGEKKELILKLESKTYEITSLLQLYLIKPDQKLKTSVDSAIAGAGLLLDGYRTLELSQAERDFFAEIKMELQKISVLTKETIADEDRQTYDIDLFTKTSREMDVLLDEELQPITMREMERSEQFATMLSLIGLVAMLITGFVSFFLIRKIFATIEDTALNTATASEQLSETSTSTASATQEIASTTQQMAASSTKATEKVEEVGKIITEMSSAITQVADNAQKSAKSAADASKKAIDAGTAAERGVKNLDAIKTSVLDSTAGIKALGEKSAKISTIIKTINDVAEQTNLLALNAAIEAARAGEQGRGFAVVADEVRKLAEESGRAAEQISALIMDMQQSTNAAVSSMEKGAEQVVQGSEVIGASLNAVKDISLAAQSISSQLQEISAATQQQQAGTQQIVAAMTELAATAEENAAGTQQVSASMQQTSAAVQQVSASARQLAEIAVRLQVLMGKEPQKRQTSPEPREEARETVQHEDPRIKKKTKR